METQRNFDINIYLNTWHEVARSKNNPWEKDCRYAIANYSLDGKNMKIVNTCLDANKNVIRESFGLARIPNPKDPSKLKVRFTGKDAMPFEGDYFVIYTDYDNYSIVGDEDRRFIWILSRKPTIAKEDVFLLLAKAKAFGYDINEIYSNPTLLR